MAMPELAGAFSFAEDVAHDLTAGALCHLKATGCEVVAVQQQQQQQQRGPSSTCAPDVHNAPGNTPAI